MSNTDIPNDFITIPTINCNGRDNGYSIVCLEHIVSLDVTEKRRGYIHVQLTSGKYLTVAPDVLPIILSRLA